MSDPIPGQGQNGQPDKGQAGNQQPQTYEVTIGGEKKSVTMEEMQKGYMQQSDYTQKTQALATDKKQFDSLVDSKASELYLAELTRLEQEGKLPKGSATPENANAAAKAAEAGADPLKAAEERIAKLEEAQANAGKKHENDKIDAFFTGAEKDLKVKYPSIAGNRKEWNEVLTQFSETYDKSQDPLAVLTKITEAANVALDKQKQDHIDGYVKDRTSGKNRAGEHGASGTPPGSTPPPEPTTFKEAREQSAAMFGN